MGISTPFANVHLDWSCSASAGHIVIRENLDAEASPPQDLRKALRRRGQQRSNQAAGRQQALLVSAEPPWLWGLIIGKKYCDEAELLPLLVEHGFMAGGGCAISALWYFGG